MCNGECYIAKIIDFRTTCVNAIDRSIEFRKYIQVDPASPGLSSQSTDAQLAWFDPGMDEIEHINEQTTLTINFEAILGDTLLEI